MPRLVKRLLLFVGLPIGLVAVAVATLAWLALRQFTAENVVHQLEAACNARVQLDNCSLSLFSSPARLELNGLHFHPRDDQADRATPPATRPPIKITNTYFRMRRGVAEVDLAALLLRREARVTSLLIEMGDVKYDILPNGDTSLRALFHRPATVGGKPNPALAALAPVAAAVAAAATQADTTPDPDTDPPAEDAQSGPIPPFHARDLGAPVAIDRISLVEARIRVRNRKTRAVTELNQLHLDITDLAVDPARLSEAKPASLKLRSRVWVDGGRKNPGRLAELEARLDGTLMLFEPASGLLQPDVTSTVTLARGATLRSLPALEKVEKNLSRARRAGLRIEAFSPDAVLAADTVLPLQLRRNTLVLSAPATLDFSDYALFLGAGSHLSMADESHEVSAAWIASQPVSDKALAGAQEFLGTLGTDAGRELRGLLIDPLVKNGRLQMDFTSTGAIAKPEVRIAHPLTDLTDQLKDAGRGLMENFKNN